VFRSYIVEEPRSVERRRGVDDVEGRAVAFKVHDIDEHLVVELEVASKSELEPGWARCVHLTLVAHLVQEFEGVELDGVASCVEDLIKAWDRWMSKSSMEAS
jgi:hypothetical protein